MPPHAKQVLDDCVSGQEALCLAGRLEAAHLSLSLPGRLVGDLGAVVGVLPRIVPHGGHGGPMRCAIAPQFVGHEAHRLCALALQELAEEALCCSSITTCLHEEVDHVAVLIDGTPEILPLALDSHEELVQEPRVTQSLVAPLQLAGVLGAELPAPLTDGLVGDDDSTLR